MLRSFCVLAAAAAFVVAAAPAASAIEVVPEISVVCTSYDPVTGQCFRHPRVCSELTDAKCDWSPGTDIVCLFGGPDELRSTCLAVQT